jgi:hypothetical protein
LRNARRACGGRGGWEAAAAGGCCWFVIGSTGGDWDDIV